MYAMQFLFQILQGAENVSGNLTCISASGYSNKLIGLSHFHMQPDNFKYNSSAPMAAGHSQPTVQ